MSLADEYLNIREQRGSKRKPRGGGGKQNFTNIDRQFPSWPGDEPNPANVLPVGMGIEPEDAALEEEPTDIASMFTVRDDSDPGAGARTARRQDEEALRGGPDNIRRRIGGEAPAYQSGVMTYLEGQTPAELPTLEEARANAIRYRTNRLEDARFGLEAGTLGPFEPAIVAISEGIRDQRPDRLPGANMQNALEGLNYALLADPSTGRRDPVSRRNYDYQYGAPWGANEPGEDGLTDEQRANQRNTDRMDPNFLGEDEITITASSRPESFGEAAVGLLTQDSWETPEARRQGLANPFLAVGDFATDLWTMPGQAQEEQAAREAGAMFDYGMSGRESDLRRAQVAAAEYGVNAGTSAVELTPAGFAGDLASLGRVGARGVAREATDTLPARRIGDDAPMGFEGAPRPQAEPIDAEFRPAPQRAFQAAVRDPETGRTYTGLDHMEAIDSAPDAATRARLEQIYNAPTEDPNAVGFVVNGQFMSREDGLQALRAQRTRPVGLGERTFLDRRSDAVRSLADDPIDWDSPQTRLQADEEEFSRFAGMPTGPANRPIGSITNDPDGIPPQGLDTTPSVSDPVEMRMERARRLGFDVETPMFHGSPDAREVRRLGGFEQRTTNAGYLTDPERYAQIQAEMAAERAANGTSDRYFQLLDEAGALNVNAERPRPVYLSNNERVARTYARDDRAFDYQGAEPDVLPLVSRGNMMVVDGGGERFANLSLDRIRQSLPEARRAEFDEMVRRYKADFTGNPGRISTNDLEDIAHGMGYDGFEVRNVRDTYNNHGPRSPLSTVRAVFDPSNLRSPDAAFDPARSSSRDLLAGVGAGGIIGVGAGFGADAVFNQEANADNGEEGDGGEPLLPILGGAAGAYLASRGRRLGANDRGLSRRARAEFDPALANPPLDGGLDDLIRGDFGVRRAPDWAPDEWALARNADGELLPPANPLTGEPETLTGYDRALLRQREMQPQSINSAPDGNIPQRRLGQPDAPDAGGGRGEQNADNVIQGNFTQPSEREREAFIRMVRNALIDAPHRQARIGQAYYERGLLPLPIGTRMRAPPFENTRTPGLEDGTWIVDSYYVSPSRPNEYGYVLRRGDETTRLAVHHKGGPTSNRPDLIGGWQAMLGPDGAEPMKALWAARRQDALEARRAEIAARPPPPPLTEAEQSEWDLLFPPKPNARAPQSPDVGNAGRRFEQAPVTDGVQELASFDPASGNVIGRMEYRPREDGSWQVTYASVDPALQGRKEGIALYEELIQRARAAGVRRLTSDVTVSPDAARVYDALERRGYRVERNPTAQRMSARADGSADGNPLFSVDLTNAPARSSGPNSLQPDDIEGAPARNVPAPRVDMINDARLTPDESYAASRARAGLAPREIAAEMDTSPESVRVLLSRARSKAPDLEIGAAQTGRPRGGDGMTQRVAALKAQGLSRAEIAERTGLTPQQVNTRLQAVSHLRRQGRLGEAALVAGIGGGALAFGDEAYAQLAGEDGIIEIAGMQIDPNGEPPSFRTVQGEPTVSGEYVIYEFSDGSRHAFRMDRSGDRLNPEYVGELIGTTTPAPRLGEGMGRPLSGAGVTETNLPPPMESDGFDAELNDETRIGGTLTAGLLARLMARRAGLRGVAGEIPGVTTAYGFNQVTGGDPMEAAILSGATPFAGRLGEYGALRAGQVIDDTFYAPGQIARDNERLMSDRQFIARRNEFAQTLPSAAPRARRLGVERDPLDGYASGRDPNGRVADATEVIEQGYFRDAAPQALSPRVEFDSLPPVEQLAWMDRVGFDAPRAPAAPDRGNMGYVDGSTDRPPRRPVTNSFVDPNSGSSVFGEPRKPRAPRQPPPPLAERAAQRGAQGAMQPVKVATMRAIADDLGIPAQGVKATDLRRTLVRELGRQFDSTAEMVAFLRRYGVTAAALGIGLGGSQMVTEPEVRM